MRGGGRDCSPGLEVPQVLALAASTGLQVCVAVELGKLCRAQAAAPVQPVHVLADRELDVAALVEANDGHVGR